MIKIKIEASNASDLRVQLLALLWITERTGNVQSILPSAPTNFDAVAAVAEQIQERETVSPEIDQAPPVTKKRRTKAEIEADKLDAEQANETAEDNSADGQAPEGTNGELKGSPEEEPAEEEKPAKEVKLDDATFREAIISWCGEDADGSRLAHCKKVRVDVYGAQKVTDIPMDKRQSYLDEIAKYDI